MEIPLTLEQHFIYDAIAQWGPNLLWNNVVHCMHLSRTLDPAVLQQAVASLIDGNEILKVRLKEAGEATVQHTAVTSAEQCLEVGRMRGTEADAPDLLAEAINRPFDLANEPPVRILLLNGQAQAFILLVAHHIFVDLHGLSLLMQQLLHVYALLSQDSRAIQDSTGETSYLDYALAQQKRIEDGSLAADASEYIASLHSAEPRLNFSARGSDPISAATRTVVFEIGRDLTSAVMQRSRAARVSLFSLMSVATFGTMSRLSGQPDLVLAAVVDMRKHPFTSVVGQFADMMLIREKKDNLASAAQSIDSVQKQVLRFLQRPVPSAYARNVLPWLEQRCRNYGVADVFIDYLGQDPGYDSLQEKLQCDVRLVFPHRGQLVEERRFDGSVLAFIVKKAGPQLSVLLQYESGLIDEKLAHEAARIWESQLADLVRRP